MDAEKLVSKILETVGAAGIITTAPLCIALWRMESSYLVCFGTAVFVVWVLVLTFNIWAAFRFQKRDPSVDIPVPAEPPAENK